MRARIDERYPAVEIENRRFELAFPVFPEPDASALESRALDFQPGVRVFRVRDAHGTFAVQQLFRDFAGKPIPNGCLDSFTCAENTQF